MSCPVYDIENPTIMHIEMAEVRRLRAEEQRLTAVLQAIAAAGICATSHLIAADALKRSAPTGSADR